MPQGFLVVFSKPGSQIPLDEFQDWYNNEHVPLRLNHLTSFLTGARFSAVDADVTDSTALHSYPWTEPKPTWVALYDIDSTSTFSQPSYTRLRETRSPRETELISRLELLDRRTCELVQVEGMDPCDSGEGMGNTKTTSLRVPGPGEEPTRFVVIHGLGFLSGGDVASTEDDIFVTSTDDSLVTAYTQSLISAVRKNVPGWVRTRTLKTLDSGRIGKGVQQDSEAQKVPKYLMIHELDSAETALSSAFQASLSISSTLNESNTRVVTLKDQQLFTLYRVYPCLAQGNLSA